MNRPLLTLSSAALGAWLMYLFDPNQGRRRRALLSDQCNHLVRQARLEVDRGVRDARNRTRGLIAEFRSSLNHEPVADDVLVERIRSKLGRCVAHAAAIRVKADHGHVTLSGTIRAAECAPLLAAVRRMPGVQDVDSQLTIQEEKDTGAEEQRRTASGEPRNLLERPWAPATRLCVVGGGGALAAYLLARISPMTVVGGALAAGLLAAANATESSSRSSVAMEQPEATGLPVELW